MDVVSITIGRGAPGTDRLLDPERWDSFVAAAIDTLFVHDFEIVVCNPGTGAWKAPDGVTYQEQNFIVQGIRPDDEDYDTPYCLQEIRERLRDLAVTFDQDAIALAHGKSELVEAEEAPHE